MKDIKIFENKKIRSNWDAEKEKWYFAVVDIIETLTESYNPQVYWRVLKKRLLTEGNETVTNCNAGGHSVVRENRTTENTSRRW